MTVDDVFKALQYGELSQLHIGEVQCCDGIPECHRPKIINHIQLGLDALYRRFRLRENRVTLQLIDCQRSYYIHEDFLVTPENMEDRTHYIKGASGYFDNSLIKIERIENHLGEDLPLNEHSNICSFRTPHYNNLVVPENIKDLTKKFVTVIYRAGHPRIDEVMGTVTPDRVELLLPPTHMEALLFFVGSRIHNPTGIGQEFNAGSIYYAKYENACNELLSQNFEIDDLDTNDKIICRGFP